MKTNNPHNTQLVGRKEKWNIGGAWKTTRTNGRVPRRLSGDVRPDQSISAVKLS